MLKFELLTAEVLYNKRKSVGIVYAVRLYALTQFETEKRGKSTTTLPIITGLV